MNLGPHPSADTPRRVSGHVASWLEGDPAWAIADRISMKYKGEPYSRAAPRVVALIAVDWMRAIAFDENARPISAPGEHSIRGGRKDQRNSLAP